MKRSTVVYAALVGVGLAICTAWATSLVGAQGASETGYKIGVVDMREVFQKYKRREAEFKELIEKRDAAQAKVDALAAEINTAREGYEAKRREATSPDELETLEMSILSDISNLEAERGKLQNEVSLIEDQKLNALNQDIRKAIAEIGQAENYHLILEAGSQGGGGVLYSATPLSLTSKVIDRLNK